ncbi:hypothetical protein ERW49_01950 [Aliivibrio finisterrensis]|uniref:Aspartate aminotransferase family protein n=1 Tax=Aliivibrio finisterrensis TaxID=511998 RepID=A0A4Q5KTZ3_9GAMM|nr:hypothetical protein ERW49_01950 [Aliivibrio finisterrensis]
MSTLIDANTVISVSHLSTQFVEENSQKEPSQKEKWQKYFIQTGEGGSDEFLSMLNHTNRTLAAVFEKVQSPYSGVKPELIEKAIQSVNLDSEPSDLRHVIDRTTELVVKNSIFVQHPNCIAHLHTPPLLSSIAAEAMIAALNQSMDSWDQASSATYVEQKVIDWVCEKYQLGMCSDGVFTSGGTQSNLMGLLLARDWIADKISQHSIQKMGLPEYSNKLRIICSKKSHFTVQKSASLLGLGERSVCCVETHSNGTIDINSLEETLGELKAEGLIPFVLVGTAGTTDHGAIDDLSTLSSIAQAEGMWFHVDAAYGGALILSQDKRRLTGIEHADSLSVDFHKLFYQTVSCGAILIKDKSNFGYLRHHADYLNREDDELPNLVDKSIATTRRFDALKVFMTMQNVGAEQLGQMYDHLLIQAKQVATLIQNNDRFELLAEPSLSTVLFRSKSTTVKELDDLNKTVRLEALTRGIAVLGETIVNHNVALKLTILNPCLNMSDFESLLKQIDNLVIEQEKIRVKQ